MTIADLGGSIHGLTGHSAVVDAAMRVIAEDFIYGIAVILVLLWFHRDGLRCGLAFALGGLVALGVGAVVAMVWSEQRPFVVDHFTPLIAHAGDPSFPSDHLLVLGALTGACLVRARPVAASAGVLALLVAVARVFVGVHYPLDVLVGFSIGTLCGLLGWFALARLAPVIEAVDALLGRRGLRPVRFGQPPGARRKTI